VQYFGNDGVLDFLYMGEELKMTHDIKVGDRVRLRDATVKGVSKSCMAIEVDGDTWLNNVGHNAISEVLPRPFKVGDRVEYESRLGDIGAEIIAIDGGYAFVKNFGSLYHAIPLTDLRHP
jgi:hypothetical protein